MELRGTLHPFVALSHCWGSCLTLKTLSTNIESFRVGIPIQDLPSTFKDAVKMTKLLGFDHLWIDSLCIVQDSDIDWEEQSSLMAFVYGNADLVLAASSASSTEDSFLKERQGYRESSLRLSCVKNKDSTLALRYRVLQSKRIPPMPDPLDRRAWAFQERLLARRYLAIGSRDTSWTCMTSSACECQWWRVASIGQIVNVKKLIHDAKDEDLGHCWREMILGHYFQRRLTVPSDNLVALSAIASIFQEKSSSKYCAGIWQGDLIRGLLWDYHLPDAGYASDSSAPSWSWASLPTLDTGHLATVNSSQAQVRVLETNTIPSTLNPFGSVSSGFIKLWGRLWRAKVIASRLTSAIVTVDIEGYKKINSNLAFDTSLIMTEVCLSDGAKERSLRRVRREEVQENFYVGNAQGRDTVTLFVVPLLKDCASSGWNLTRGLILGRSPKDPTKFERVGVLTTASRTAVDHEDGLDKSDEQEIVII